ncbi:hypothetical protein PoB_000477800 [Plakobranchus ocellatus]|uniref:Uncharacterized protein n=1 Tax=Plakobranchus ocellatus TaxID=259542 RepID=A0AAV3Y6X2_9GAST|nr:hypothetical protein PoB_000477800 [Plakobranchus ocellatus]
MWEGCHEVFFLQTPRMPSARLGTWMPRSFKRFPYKRQRLGMLKTGAVSGSRLKLSMYTMSSSKAIACKVKASSSSLLHVQVLVDVCKKLSGISNGILLQKPPYLYLPIFLSNELSFKFCA